MKMQRIEYIERVNLYFISVSTKGSLEVSAK